MLKSKKFVQDTRHVQIVLSFSDDQEFKDLEEIRQTVKDASASLQSKMETNKTRLEEHRKVLQGYEETLEKQENRMKACREELAELQKKLSDTEKRLEKSRKQIEQNHDEISRQTKEKESLMISDESNESSKKAAFFSEEAKFYAVISCIRWDANGQSHEIRGCIAERNNVDVFDFDKREKSQFYITNKLWEKMDPSNDWKNLFTGQSECREDAIILHSKPVKTISDCGSKG